MNECVKEDIINKLDKEIFGNGGKGLIKEFTELKTEFRQMNEHIEKMATSVSALARSQIEHDAIERSKVKSTDKRNSSITIIGVVASIVFGAVATLYLILEHQ